MSFRITTACTACGMCIHKCPTRAIYVNKNDLYAIDPARCTECIDLAKPRCCAVCPARAIEPDLTHRETSDALWAKRRARAIF